MLNNKKIVLGVCGSIAAYKSAILTRLLIKSGAEVKIILTPDAHNFITPLTLSTLSKNPVLSEYSNSKTGQWNNHVELAHWADVILIAPITANTLAKMANGICDNLLLATYFSAKCKTILAPAMDLEMYKHDTVTTNLNRLLDHGNLIIPAETGELASGLTGEGRMAEPEHIHAFIESFFLTPKPLFGLKAMVSAGPTYEKIDPVRFLGNHSSGKMGIAIANALHENGAQVSLIIGPTHETDICNGIEIVSVTTAHEMHKACISLATKSNIVVMSAAVADYTPKHASLNKLKKSADELCIELVKTPDILKELGEHKPKDQILVGFALETENGIEHAKNKLKSKNLDFIVLNSLEDEGAGFKTDTNKITIIDSLNQIQSFDLKSKKAVANDIVIKITELAHAK